MYTLGIDLHKRSSVWVLLNDARDVLHKSTVTTHPLDINIAIERLPVAPKDVRVVIEPTGGWRWVADILEQSGMTVHIANPTKVRLIAESKKKFDAGDAQTLADLLRADYLPEAYRAPNAIDTLRMLVRERAYFVRLRTSVKTSYPRCTHEEGGTSHPRTSSAEARPRRHRTWRRQRNDRTSAAPRRTHRPHHATGKTH
ncbi:MAG: hypothetical protein A2942_04785 [Candidatus Lloydbacteria bacterium RIFCSPLOWO2_01_FULL_50_20]|uniref:Transposase IS110-like N-terminal domain-containing protein n=1 Tax=Candidatus Lloydbacteria bacterium RIFCSPLOWO2_01_FULL_50_20 TaxID=1798665 RepID=A0A1G2DGF1_9BACT|nr:MAG: hypothetical protein A3C13_01055 [Candidatus Lloydbacteria bacterium RIFCSPHIGHO2_02_FULL_50_11]OGZ12764.1 MAG: hypothetical protein A2942_04785 [Candidatus Lloydbacteria bacterium RIFCSPLOWO2_01_FULL_50_20]